MLLQAVCYREGHGDAIVEFIGKCDRYIGGDTHGKCHYCATPQYDTTMHYTAENKEGVIVVCEACAVLHALVEEEEG